jgi:carboxyl-terminal processing protease
MLGVIAGLALSIGAGSVVAQVAPPAPPAAAEPSQTTLNDLSERVWTTARSGKETEAISALKGLPEEGPGVVTALRSSASALDANIAKREATRKAKLTDVSAKLDAQLAKDSPDAVSEALKHAIELYVLSTDKASVKADARIKSLVTRATEAAHDAEAQGNWFTANELFYRLGALMEEEGTYKPDIRRLGMRLSMIRMYAPEEFWSLRNSERLKAGKPGLPAYNGLGEDYTDKVKGIDKAMVLRGVAGAVRQQIDRVPMRDAMLSGTESLRAFVTTVDLRKVFPAIGDEGKREAFITWLDRWNTRLTAPSTIASPNTLSEFVDDLLAVNKTTLNVPDGAILHEFGSGAMQKLDEFSQIIWPDELARFDRMTSGQFRGVGVHIQLDEETQMVKVITPLEGTPAQRAGIKAGDLIKKINGKSAVGISLNQAIDLITGPVDSKVNVTMERATDKTDDKGRSVSEDVDFTLARAVIPVNSVKGWKRIGAREDAWDWFVDHQNKIGYIRLTQFTDNTTADLHNAIKAMQNDGGLNALVLDLRFNPGGLLTEAVSVANTFIPQGVIVSTEGTVPGDKREATPAGTLVRDIPVAVLINEGSASASEIVSGAMRFYADRGDINAILVGARSYGKGSVQNVWALANNAKIKVTTQYYKLPDGKIIHRKPGATDWGVSPHLTVEMLPDAIDEALKLRQDADVLPIDQNGNIVMDPKAPRPDPQKLLDDGIDLQLQTALVLLKTRNVAHADRGGVDDGKRASQ